MGGSEGKQAQNFTNPTQSGTSSPQLAKLMSDYASGKVSQADALKQANDIGANVGGGGSAIQTALATGPATAEKFASEQVQSDPTLGKYFGSGGMQDQVLGAQKGLESNLADDRQALSGKGEQYGLTDQDLKAYGQASGNAARTFGAQEQGLAQSLSDRGLGAAPSGSAGAEFSGLQGNKNEMLSGIQNQIAQNRINTAKGLAEFRTNADAEQAARNQNAALNLGNLGANAINAGRAANQGEQGHQQNALEDAQSQANIEFGQQQATKKKSFGETLGDAATEGLASGIGSSISDIAGAPGQLAQSFTGAVGKAGGSAAAKSGGNTLAAAMG